MKTTPPIHPIHLAVIVALGISGAACHEDARPKEALKVRADPPKAAPAAAQNASAGVQAGSHEDWCEEHQVPESLCTRCNPSLVAAFKATDDWCEEHGLPESQCRVCNPEVEIERPPKQDGAK